MTEKIKLVQGDTRPQLLFSLTDETTGDPIDLTGATLLLKFRVFGADTIKENISASPIAGRVLEDGSITYAAPYNVFGAGGRAALDWTPTALNEAGEFEGELEITFPDGDVQTAFERLRFKVREQF